MKIDDYGKTKSRFTVEKMFLDETKTKYTCLICFHEYLDKIFPEFKKPDSGSRAFGVRAERHWRFLFSDIRSD